MGRRDLGGKRTGLVRADDVDAAESLDLCEEKAILSKSPSQKAARRQEKTKATQLDHHMYICIYALRYI